MNKKDITTNTYDRAALEYAVKFNNLKSRDGDIQETFQLCGAKNPKTLEIGCGNGRDAKKILEYTNDYLGIDISSSFLELAKKENPTAEFILADIENFEMPKNLDVVFAFASLLHSPKEELQKVIDNIFNCLNPNGVVRISLKHSDDYREVVKEDDHGVRYFYFYSKEDIQDLCKKFKILKLEVNNLLGQDWLEALLQKSNN